MSEIIKPDVPVEEEKHHIDMEVPKKKWGMTMKDGIMVLYLPLKFVNHIAARGVIDFVHDVALNFYSAQAQAELEADAKFRESQAKFNKSALDTKLRG